MAKSTFNIFIAVGSVIFALGLVLSSAAGYAVWRSFESIGVYPFTSTGELLVKEEREKTGRRSSKTVRRNYAIFTSQDGKYLSEEKISTTQKNYIARGSRYTVEREVFVDRVGDYKVTSPQGEAAQNQRSWNNLIAFLCITAVGAGTAIFSYRLRKTRT